MALCVCDHILNVCERDTKPLWEFHRIYNLGAVCRVHTGQGKLEKVREFEWSGKVRENAKVTGKSGKFWGKILPLCIAVVMLIIVELESNPPYC